MNIEEFLAKWERALSQRWGPTQSSALTSEILRDNLRQLQAAQTDNLLKWLDAQVGDPATLSRVRQRLVEERSAEWVNV